MRDLFECYLQEWNSIFATEVDEFYIFHSIVKENTWKENEQLRLNEIDCKQESFAQLSFKVSSDNYESIFNSKTGESEMER